MILNRLNLNFSTRMFLFFYISIFFTQIFFAFLFFMIFSYTMRETTSDFLDSANFIVLFHSYQNSFLMLFLLGE